MASSWSLALPGSLRQIDKEIDAAELSDLARPLFWQLVKECRYRDARVAALDDMLIKIAAPTSVANA